MTDPEDIIVSSVEITPEAVQALAKYNAWMSKCDRQPRALLHRTHKFLDQFVDAMHVPENSPCKRGCNACCTHNVDVTQVEAALIAKHYKIPVKGLKQGRVMYEHEPSKYDGQLCPMNKDGECQIYEWRPIVCRVFFSQEATPDPCFVKGGGGVQFNYRSNPVFEEIIKTIGWGTNVQGGGDIRDFFGTEPIEVKK